MKRFKGIASGLLVTLLAVGIVYAAYVVWTGTDDTTVQEPLETEWVVELPYETYPNQEYESKIKVHNIDVTGNGNQLVGVVVTGSGSLVRKDICWDKIGDGLVANCGWLFGQKMTFTLVKNGDAFIWAKVQVASDATPGAESLQFEVSRE